MQRGVGRGRLGRIGMMFSFRRNTNCKNSASSLRFNSKIPLKLKWNEGREVEVRFEISQVCKGYSKISIFVTD